ncbi:MAG: GNAT family N-acetyltransferase [Gammaproteobacteria bacterium]|nr:GNAT family N-acetyltransferase [Gammaproteobacteria bacterium]
MTGRIIRREACCLDSDVQQKLNTDLPVFLRPDWYDMFDRFVRQSDGNTVSLCLRDDAGSGGYLPLYEAKGGLTRCLYSLTNFYSPAFDLVGVENPRREDYEHFVRRFRRYFARFELIDFSPLTEQQAEAWRHAFATIGFQGFVYRKSTNWYHDGVTDLAGYWEARPSRLRNTFKRKAEKLRKSGGFEVGVVAPGSEIALWEYLAHYHRVYYSSWKRAEPYPAFIDAIAEYAWKLGELRMGMAYHEGEPVAGQIWFVCGRKAYIFKLAHRPEYSKYSVGTILSKAMFDHVIDVDRVEYIDFLTGDDGYKADWMNGRRGLFGIQLCNSRTLGGAAYAARNVVSGWYKRLSRVEARA